MNANTRSWIEALRCGRYRQTRGRLRRKSRLFWLRPGFCAIGVLYDLYLQSRGEKWPAKPFNGELPETVLAWAGISRELEFEVVQHNDFGRSFAEIASLIEAHVHYAERERRWNEAGLIARRCIADARDGARADLG